MGIYCTTTSLAIVMVGTTFDSATTALGGKCITWAEAEINKYLSKRYDLTDSLFATSTSIPPMVTTWAEQLAQGYMYKNMGRGGKEARERGQDLIDGVLKNLEMIKEHDVDLIDSDGDVVPEMAASGFQVLSNTKNYSSTFNEDDELSWCVSSNKLDDVSSERDE